MPRYLKIKNYIKSYNHKLLSWNGKYDTKMSILCPNGHQYEITYGNFYNGRRCPKCSGKLKHEYKFVKETFENEGYILLSKEYINNKKYLDFICPNGHKHKISFISFLKGQRCGICSGKSKHGYDYIKQSFETEGYTLLTKEYVNAQQYLEYICPNGHKHNIIWKNWQQGQRCGLCRGTHKYDYDYIKQSFEKEGYTLLTKEYINAHEKIDILCPSGHKYGVKFNNWQQGKRCGKCAKHGISKPEKEILEYVKNNYNGTIIENDRTVIKNIKTNRYLELDIWLPELNKAIEYNSEWWHRNRVEFDQYKQKWCKENNIGLLTIEHNKWLENKDWNKINKFIS